MIVAFLFGCLLFPPAAKAGQYLNFTYAVSGSNVIITKYTGPRGSAIIPGTILGKAVTGVDDEAFAGCGLTSVGIPDSVTSIGRRAFADSYFLASISIPKGVTNLGSASFSSCPSLAKVAFAGIGVTGIGSMTFFSCVKLTGMDLPSSVTSIGDWAFSGCYGLRTMAIPNGVTNIGDRAFEGCTGLANVVMPNSVATVGSMTFINCTHLTNVVFGSGVTSIGNMAFWSSGLTQLTIPDSVTAIGESAFHSCGNLSGVTIGEGVTQIGFEMFSDCGRLASVRLPNRAVSIEARAFYFCTNLASLTMGQAVANIGDQAFSGCANLEVARIEGNAPAVVPGAFAQDKKAIVYYRSGAKGWGPVLDGRPTVPYSLVVLSALESTMVLEGAAAALSAQVGGTPTLSFQWFVNGQPLAGETNGTLTIPSISATNVGDYLVVANNPFETVTNGPATLGVNNVMPTHFLGLILSGDAGPSTRIEFATNLSGPWTPLTGARLADNPNAVIDLTDTASGQRFYRATPAVRLDARRWPGWTFAGPSGAAYQIEYVTAATGFGNWQFLTNLTLPESPYLFINTTATNDGLRFYRTTPLP